MVRRDTSLPGYKENMEWRSNNPYQTIYGTMAGQQAGQVLGELINKLAQLDGDVEAQGQALKELALSTMSQIAQLTTSLMLFKASERIGNLIPGIGGVILSSFVSSFGSYVVGQGIQGMVDSL